MQPPKLKFKNLKQSNSSKSKNDNYKTLYIYFNYKSKEHIYSSKLQIDPKWWNNETHRLNHLTKKAIGEDEYKKYKEIIGDNYADFNKKLDLFEESVERAITKFQLNGQDFDVKTVVLEIFEKNVRNSIEDDRRYEVYLYDLMIKLKSDKKFYNVFLESSDLAESTKKGHFIAITHTINFLEGYNKLFKIKDYDKNYILDFCQWLSSNTKVEKGSTQINYLDRLEKILKCASRKFNLNIDFSMINRPKFLIELCDFQALNLDELKKLLNLKLCDQYIKESRYLKKEYTAYINEEDLVIRDLFVFGCLIGLRFTDLTTLKDTDLKFEENRYFVSKLTGKTNTRVKVPLSEPAVEILKKYDFKFPKLNVGSQMFNIRIKNIVKASGINDEIDYFDGKESVKEFKFNLISSHTMRRSFASIMYFQMKMQPKQIMKFTGHSSLATFEKYLRISENQDISVFNDPKWDQLKVE